MRRHRHLICFLAGFLLVLCFYYANYQHVHEPRCDAYDTTDVSLFVIPTKINNSNAAFLVDTSVCKIPRVDPFDKSVKHLLKNGSVLKCETKVDIVYVEGNTIYIDWKAINESRFKNNIEYCRYDVIWRPYDERKDHDFMEYRNESKNFTDQIDVSDEFVRVKCYSGINSIEYTNFFSFVHLKKEVEKRCKENFQKFENSRKEHLSVLMLGVDSISRINMMRYMTETRSYLLNKMSAIELVGYNKVADNTFVNIVPMTAGKYVDQLPWNESIRWTSMNEYNFIWDNYSANGYRTLYVEDHPEIAIFDFGKSGFQIPPGDYFNRHFTIAMENTKSIWDSAHYCVHGRKEANIHLDYIEQFTEQFKENPYFAFAFLTRLTHSYLEETKKADKLYSDFFKHLNERGNLQNTVVFFYSDHGMRFGNVRETFVGKLEERLPYMFIVFPPWFLQKYPHIRKNLEINAKRLTTPFDIFATLSDILKFTGNNREVRKKERAMSLLNEIPESRTCEDADILPHWCTCSQHQQLNVTNKTVINIGLTMVSKINDDLTKAFDVCEKLFLKTIKYALRVIPSDKVLRFEQSKNDVIDRTVLYGERVNTYVDYQITLQTKPGDAVFEGTLRYDENEKTLDLVGDISRINKYGSQSHCVEGYHLRKLCYCKKQL